MLGGENGPLNLYADNERCGPLGSLVWVFLVAGALPLALALTAWLRARWYERRARRNEALRTTTSGEHVAVGRVRADDEEPVASVRVAQRWWRWIELLFFEWFETGRTWQARPFDLERDGAPLLRVEPDERVALQVALGAGSEPNAQGRVRTAQVRAGEAVFVAGVLTPGSPSGEASYRDPSTETTLRAAAISSSPFEDLDRDHARVHRGWVLRWLALGVVLQLPLAPFHARRLFGHVVMTTVVDVDRYEDWEHPVSGSGKTRRVDYTRKELSEAYYYVRGRYTEGEATFEVKDHVSRAFHDALQLPETHTADEFYAAVAAQPKVPFIVVPSWPRLAHVGTANTIARWQARGIVALLLWAGWSFLRARLRSRRWYERGRIVEGSLFTSQFGAP
jgi:hypothetical protein